MNKDISKILMNPYRLRIVQYLAIHKQGTTKELAEELHDIPQASLYRHIKILFDAGLISVVAEKKIRGTIEKTYALKPNPTAEDVSMDEVAKIIQTSLLSLLGQFGAYFRKEECDPQKDMLMLSTSTLLLTDEEYTEVLMKMGKVIQEVIANPKTPERRMRRLTLVSSPCEEEK